MGASAAPPSSSTTTGELAVPDEWAESARTYSKEEHDVVEPGSSVCASFIPSCIATCT
jgi:hypothetical protein